MAHAPGSLRRSATTSAVSSPSPSSPGTSGPRSEELVETLYTHPSVKIISFTSNQRTSFATGLPSKDDVDLPPSSRLERTIAVGPFRIYRAPGSVAFLNCGSALQPILPKSQCWCLDEDNSRFVLQIRRPQYWRIELPVTDPADEERALILRDVLDKVLQFEKTRCPFQRTFEVDLPDEPITPVKKKAWTAEGKNLIQSPFQSQEIRSSASPPAVPSSVRRAREAANSPRGLSSDRGGMRKENPGGSEERRGRLAAQEDTFTSSDERSDSVWSMRDMSRGSASSMSRLSYNTSASPAARRGPKDESREKSPTNRKPVTEIVDDYQTISKNGTNMLPNYGISDRRSSQAAENPSSPAVTRPSEMLDEVQSYSDRETSAKSRPRPKPLDLEKPHDDTKHGDVKRKSLMFNNVASQSQPTAQTGSSHTKKTGAPGTSSGQSSEDQHTIGGGGDDDNDDSEKDEKSSTFEGSGHVAPVSYARKRKSRILAGRAFTAPPKLTVKTSPSSQSEQPTASNRASSSQVGSRGRSGPPQSSGENSPVESMDSFHSVESQQSPTTPLPPSPPMSRPVTPSVVSFPPPHDHITKDVSSLTATPKADATFASGSVRTVRDRDNTRSPPPRSPVRTPKAEPPSSTPAPTRAQSSAVEERPPGRHRARTSTMSISRRALSPLPPAANLFSPPVRQPVASASRLAAMRGLPSAIITKTVEILLSPPSHLINLMLEVAAMITGGEWRGFIFGTDASGEATIPVQWDYSDSEFSDWEEDDEYVFGSGEGIQKLASHTPAAAASSSSGGGRGTRSRRGTAANRDQRPLNSPPWEVD